MDKETTKLLGILGDSLTLLGSITLALETLLKQRTIKRQRASLGTAGTFQAGGFVLKDKKGKPVDPKTIEDRDINIAKWLALIGVGLLVIGFAVLLANRILGE